MDAAVPRARAPSGPSPPRVAHPLLCLGCGTRLFDIADPPIRILEGRIVIKCRKCPAYNELSQTGFRRIAQPTE